MSTRPRKLSGGRKPARCVRRGFTLVELMVVIIILGLSVVAVVVGGYLAFRDTEQLKDEARTLAGFLESVRTKTALDGRKHVVEYSLDDEQQKYFVWMPRNPEEGDVYEYDELTDETFSAKAIHNMPTRKRAGGEKIYAVWIDRIAFGDGSETDDQEVRIDFLPTGGSHWHLVYLTNAEGEFYTIEVNPFTGQAEVYPGEYEPEPPQKVDK